jgi:DNA-binding PadR family transcriptional regulator
VLGLIALRGPSTPYDLKRATGRSVAYFWSFPHSQLYGEPDRLAQGGFLHVDEEVGGRNRKIYSLTDTGHNALAEWLTLPSQAMFELRDPALLQLFFSELADDDMLVSLAEQQLSLHRARRDEYHEIENHYANHKDRQKRLAPLRFGILLEEAYIKYWSELTENPPRDG